MAKGDVVSGRLTASQSYRPASGVTVMLTALEGYAFFVTDGTLLVNIGVITSPNVRFTSLDVSVSITNSIYLVGSSANTIRHYFGLVVSD